MTQKIEYVCNCCGAEDIDKSLMEQIEKGDRTLHVCFDCRKLKKKRLIPVNEFKALHKYDVVY